MEKHIKLLKKILYNLFYTDLVMYKEGVIYTLNEYQEKTKKRLNLFFKKIEKYIKKNNKEKILEILKKKEENYEIKKTQNYQFMKKNNIIRVDDPINDTRSAIVIREIRIYRAIIEKLENDKVEFNLKKIKEEELYLLKDKHKRFRKNLKEYGYKVKKEKKIKSIEMVKKEENEEEEIIIK